jgi:tRNA G18 (ribose-2'-O)-methylase SpoU
MPQISGMILESKNILWLFTQVLVLGREKEGIPVDIIHILDACVEIPQFGVVRSLNVHVSGAIALWEYTRQQRSK